MAVQLICKVRDRQPTNNAGKTLGLRFVALGNGYNGFRHDLVCGNPLAVGGTPRATQKGIGVVAPISTIKIGAVGPIDGYTLIAVVSGDAGTAANWIGADRSTRYFQFRADTTSGAGVLFIAFDTSGAPFVAYAHPEILQNSNTFHVVLATVGAGYIQAWSAEIGKPPVTSGQVAITSPKLIESYQEIYVGSRDGGGTNQFSGTMLSYAVLPVKITEQQIIEICRNPWQIFEPETIPLFFSTVTAQYARPTSDVSAGTWTASSGSDLFAMLDETAANDTDYIVTTGTSTCEVALGSLADPVSSSGHIVRYRIAADSGGITVRLRQGTTTIATWTHASAPTSLTTYAQTLTGGEADSISDYSALRLQFEATP